MKSPDIRKINKSNRINVLITVSLQGSGRFLENFHILWKWINNGLEFLTRKVRKPMTISADKKMFVHWFSPAWNFPGCPNPVVRLLTAKEKRSEWDRAASGSASPLAKREKIHKNHIDDWFLFKTLLCWRCIFICPKIRQPRLQNHLGQSSMEAT